jgi:EAL domain-containing protein (putative c-di-GMP-specific phosphodiesterase class I)
MHAAAHLVAATRKLGLALPMAVNLSPKQLQRPGIEAALLAACEREGVSPRMLELELTESALLHGMELMRPLLARLRDAGFSLALDDFGTGYSSLSYLRQLPFNKVKIDRSFVLGLHDDPRAARLLESIVRLCEGLQMTTVAEGVESRQQFEALRALGVQEFQGYYFSQPVLVPQWLRDLGERGEAVLNLMR